MHYDPQADSEQLMKLYRQEIKRSPELPNRETLLLRARLVFEEAMEFVKACGCDVNFTKTSPDILEVFTDPQGKPDLVEYADACGDILVVTYGALNTAGIQPQPLMEEIHRSNMSKVFPDGTIHKREDGKVLKPDTYSPADIKTVLRKCRSLSTTDILTRYYPELKESIGRGENLWSRVATEAYGVAYKFTYSTAQEAKDIGDIGEFSRPLLARNAAKAIVFFYPTPISAKRLATYIKTTEPIADELLTLFEKRFPKLISSRPALAVEPIAA